MFRAIGRFPFGEALLWLLFLGFTLVSASDYYAPQNGPEMAAVCALAAIGVRATRRERSAPDAT
jgi:hypothetical protein